jgi:hypothetical protein
MLPPVSPLTARQRHLLQLFNRLSEDDRKTLAAFAEFLAARETREDDSKADAETADTPRHIPRPQQESVIAALKRLSTTYFMLDKAEMLDQTSALMTEHIMQGRPAEEVIDQLEAIFARHYSRLEARTRD